MKKIIVANWKMNPDSLREAKELFAFVKKKFKKSKTQIIVCPPAVYLESLNNLNQKNKNIFLGGQDFFKEEGDSWTGKLSLKMLKNSGAKFCLLGHSELVALGESDEEINFKLKKVLKERVKAILCVGEKERDINGDYFSYLEKQLQARLNGVGQAFLKNLVIAYEPSWAIGNKAKGILEPEELVQMKIFIKRFLSDKYGSKKAETIKILYGGSVFAKNAEVLLETGIDGFLLGRASLKEDEFAKILDIVNGGE